MGLVLLEPAVEVEVVVLLRPQHPGEGLAVDAALVFAQRAGRDPVVELVGVGHALSQRLLESRAELPSRGRPRGRGEARRPGSRPAGTSRMYRAAAFVPVFAGLTASLSPEITYRWNASLTYGVELGWPHSITVLLSFSVKRSSGAPSQESVYSPRSGWGGHDGPARPHEGPACAFVSPGPCVPEPQRRKSLEACRLLSAVVDGHTDQEVLRAFLRVFQEDVEVAVVVEDPGVEELVFELLPRPLPVRVQEVPVGELALRVFVEVLHVRMGRRGVDVEVVLLDVFSVVPLAVGEAEHPLLEDGVALVPEGEGEAQALLVVGDPAEAVFAPPVGPGPGLVVREVVPGVSVRAVVLADRPPLPLAEVGAPLLPGDSRLAGVVEPLLLGGVHDPGVTGSVCHRFVLLQIDPRVRAGRAGPPRGAGDRSRSTLPSG
jgi:hypothetical protein